jgi:hypothetical protein
MQFKFQPDISIYNEIITQILTIGNDKKPK